jgi:hypothetical protein
VEDVACAHGLSGGGQHCALWRWLRRAALRRMWWVLASWRSDLSVGHAGCSSFLDEMFGREEPATMMLVDFQPEIRPFVRWLFAAGRLPEVGSSYQGDIARKTQPPRPNGGLRLRGGAPKWARKRVCTMCTPWA